MTDIKTAGERSESCVKGHTDKGGGRRQRDSTDSETCDEEDVESPLLDPIPWDPCVLLPQLCNE